MLVRGISAPLALDQVLWTDTVSELILNVGQCDLYFMVK